MMTNHFTDEAVELMTAQLFIQPQPFTTPKYILTTLAQRIEIRPYAHFRTQAIFAVFNTVCLGFISAWNTSIRTDTPELRTPL